MWKLLFGKLWFSELEHLTALLPNASRAFSLSFLFFIDHSSSPVCLFLSVCSCFLSLLLVAAVVWKIKQSCWASRRREVSQKLILTTNIDFGYSGRSINRSTKNIFCLISSFGDHEAAVWARRFWSLLLKGWDLTNKLSNMPYIYFVCLFVCLFSFCFKSNFCPRDFGVFCGERNSP